jgi:hypothetical protein
MAIATVYLETTVVSYLTARDAREDIIVAHQRMTWMWWEGQRQSAAIKRFVSRTKRRTSVQVSA